MKNRRHDWDRILELVAEGKTDAEVGRIVGCTAGAVWNVRHKNGIGQNYRHRPNLYRGYRDWFSMPPWERMASIVQAATSDDYKYARRFGLEERDLRNHKTPRHK